MTHLIIYLKWCFLVGINVIVSTFFAMDIMKRPEGALGVILGILTFVFIYARMDIFLLNHGKIKWRNALYIGVAIKSLFQLFPMIDLITGAMASQMVSNLVGYDILMNDNVVFFEIYLTTIIDGLLLSILALVLTLSSRLIYNDVKKSGNQPKAQAGKK